jgi:hypothetical protein
MGAFRNAAFGALAAAALTAAHGAPAAIIFADDFNDDNVSDWTIAPGSKGSAGIAVSGGVIETYFNAPASTGAGYAGADHSFILASDASNVTLKLRGRTLPCGGCVMRYQALIDGSIVVEGTDTSFADWTVPVTLLNAGTHIISLRHATNAASSGHFAAFFDDVTIEGTLASPVPEPASWALAIGGLLLLGNAMRRRAVPAFA